MFATKMKATSTSFQIGLMGPFYLFDWGKVIAPQNKFLIIFLQMPFTLMSDINKGILNTAFTGNISIQWVYHHHNKTRYIASKGLKIRFFSYVCHPCVSVFAWTSHYCDGHIIIFNKHWTKIIVLFETSTWNPCVLLFLDWGHVYKI